MTNSRDHRPFCRQLRHGIFSGINNPQVIMVAITSLLGDYYCITPWWLLHQLLVIIMLLVYCSESLLALWVLPILATNKVKNP